MYSSITADVAKAHRDDMLAEAARNRRGPHLQRGVRRFRRPGFRQSGN